MLRLEEGKQPCPAITPEFNPQDYFSEVTAWTPATRHKKGAKYTEINPLAPKTFRRSHSFKPDDTDPGDGPTAAKALLARMLGNMVSWTLTLPGFRDPSGALFAPNTTLTLKAPHAMIFQETELLVRTVTMRQDANASTTSLKLVLPGAFSGELPTRLPWDD
jgi:prophage tail gpP-like protein